MLQPVTPSVPYHLRGGVMRGTPYSRRAIISGGGSGGLQDDVPSTCFLLEASNSSSTDGSSQTWSNVIVTPADGSAQTDFDMYRGDTSSATTDDPSFTGTAGVAGAYWSLDGGDTMATIASNPPPGFLEVAHMTTGGTAWWIAVAVRIALGSTKCVWSTQSAAGAQGMRWQSSASEVMQFFQIAASVNTSFTHDGTTDYTMIVSSAAGGGTHRYWINNRTNTTFSRTYTASTTSPDGKFTIGGISPTATRLPSGSRIYAAAGGNAYLDDTDAGYIFDYFNASTGITFA